VYPSLVVGGVGRCSAIDNTESTDTVRVHGLATAVYKRIVGVSVRVGAVGGRVWAGVAAGIAVAV